MTFSGLPMLLGFASGPLAYYFKMSGRGELPAPVMYTLGTATFALAAAGISYGVLSASWDPRRAGSALVRAGGGSLLHLPSACVLRCADRRVPAACRCPVQGWDEFSTNLPIILDRFFNKNKR